MLNQTKSKGITLVALVITIIVLLILAGIVIGLTIGENGIINKSKDAGKTHELASIKEQIQMEILGKVDNNINLSDNDIIEILQKYAGEKGQVVYRDGKPVGVNPNKYPDDTIWLADMWNGNTVTGQVNPPKLVGQLEAVYWDETTQDWKTPTSNEEWYDYGNRKWANAVIRDDDKKITSHWVWIPRYEYKISESNKGTSLAGEILINFISTNIIQPSDEYKIHPAFRDGSSTGYINGEWDSELSGIWVAKFEASRLNATLTSTGNSGVATIRPDVRSWTNITTGNSSTICLNMLPKEYGSHMMKNSEWGAVAYLTQSKYGKYGEDGQEVEMNDKNVITGGGDYKTKRKQSSTGTIYGIYDLNGGAWERTASNISNVASTKYQTSYPYTSSNTEESNRINFKNNYADTRYGDAIIETASLESATSSWYSDFSNFPHSGNSFFVRGGSHLYSSSAGIFAFYRSNGATYVDNGFRPVLAF